MENKVNAFKVFDGKDFHLWFMRLECFLCRKDLSEYIEESTIESQFLKASYDD